MSKLGSQHSSRIYEAAAIAFYHQQSAIPQVKTLLCDDAPQFKLITDDLALCWIHEGRHYKKLSAFVAYHQKVLDDFLEQFWKYYRRLLAYRSHAVRGRTEVGILADFSRDVEKISWFASLNREPVSGFWQI